MIKIFNNTKIDVFKQKFKFEEKNNFFLNLAPNSLEMLVCPLRCKKYKDIIMQPKVEKLGDVFKLKINYIHIGYFLL